MISDGGKVGGCKVLVMFVFEEVVFKMDLRASLGFLMGRICCSGFGWRVLW